MSAEFITYFGLSMLAKALGTINFKKSLVKADKDMDKIISINLANYNCGRGFVDDW